MSKTSPWRSAFAIRLFLVATLVAAAFLGAYGYFAPASDEAAQGGNSAVNGSKAASPSDGAAASFTSADAGACLTWKISADGTVTGFEQTTCDQPHRFEVSAREDLSTYPTSEFGPDATRPDINRQNALRDELCESSTVSYLKGAWDPSGRYDVASVLPPASAWDQGDRTLLCGLQTTDTAGVPQLSTGKVADNDQAVVAQPGECRAIAENQAMTTVDCAKPHQLETVSVVNLAQQFPNAYPAAADLDNFLSQTCNDAAIKYLGNEENLYQSTLQPFWGTLTQEQWNGGSRSVNCSLMHANNGGFSTLTGTATAGRDSMTIDGATPAAPPARNPLRTDASAAPSAAPASDANAAATATAGTAGTADGTGATQ